jgi:hypothetical protein
MLEIKGKPQRIHEDLFPEGHLPLRKGHISVEELLRDLSHNKVRSLSTTFPFPTKVIFSTKRQDHNPHKLVAAQHTSGASQ